MDFKKVRNLLLLLSVLTAVFLTGCAMKFGTDFDPQEFQDWVKRGETTKSQVVQYLGAPTSEGNVIESDGTVLKRLLYYYGKGKLYKMDQVRFKMLEIKFDQDNKVHSFNWSSSD